jgi:TolB-like protein
MSTRLHIRRLVAALASAATLSGCAALTIAPTDGRLMVSSNYSGADALVAQLHGGPDDTGAVLVASLANVDRLDDTSTFGRISADELGSRLAQHGMAVIETRMRDSYVVRPGGQFMLSDELRLLASRHKAGAVLVGTYADAGSSVLVSLKLVRIKDSRVIAGADYAIPMSADTHAAVFGLSDQPLEASSAHIPLL